MGICYSNDNIKLRSKIQTLKENCKTPETWHNKLYQNLIIISKVSFPSVLCKIIIRLH